jgi:crotonobetainyl-CoA:carnitine CoA-transferase CaiB-like acyl-CoA transferase
MDAASLPHILSGCKVLDFTQYLAGPACTRLMAEMGAEIIKVEQWPTGDPSRNLPFIKEGRSGYFVQQNRGKQSLCLDFKKPESMEILTDLVKHVDIVVENYGPGVLEKRGLDYESLRKINPRIIMASISAFGRKGPLSHKTGYDYIAQAFSGLSHMTGYLDRSPVMVGMAIADVGSGVHAFAGLGYALYYREKTGQGQHIDLAMVDALFHMHEVNIQAYTLSEGAIVPHRMGSHHELVCPCGIYQAPEGHIAMIVLDLQWPNLTKAMGKPELTNDPRFATASDRGKNQKELIPMIEAWLQSFPNDDAALQALEDARIAAGPVLSIEKAIEHPHYIERQMIRTVPDPLLGEITIPGFPLKFSATPDLPDIQAPLLGEHGPRVLKDYLGWDDNRVEIAKQAGVLHMERR